MPPHVGRGGWTWYTGAAGWLYRAGLESILGFRVAGNALHMEPCIPMDWPGYEIHFKHRSATYVIVVDNPQRVSSGIVEVTVDGTTLAGAPWTIQLNDDGLTHKVLVVMG